MMFKLSIECDNAAFDDNIPAEIARILRELADKMEFRDNVPPWPLHDINGNRVGNATLK